MRVTRKRIRIAGVTIFVDPRTDLTLDRERGIFLHYLPEREGGTEHKSSIRYQLVKYPLGYYVRVLGFFDYEVAVKSYANGLIHRAMKPEDIRKAYRRYTRKVPARAKEIIDQVYREVTSVPEFEKEVEIPRPSHEYSREFFDYLSRERSLWDVPFRTVEGFVRNVSNITGEFAPTDYLPIFQRIRDASVTGFGQQPVSASRNNIFAILDSSGFRITKEREWLMSSLSDKKKKWITMHIVVDPETMNIDVVK